VGFDDCCYEFYVDIFVVVVVVEVEVEVLLRVGWNLFLLMFVRL